MGKYLTNTEAYTKLGATYSGSKGNWFATKEDVMEGGGIVVLLPPTVLDSSFQKKT